MSSEQPDLELSETAQQINDLFDSAELSKAIETEEFKQFLDYIPIAIVGQKNVTACPWSAVGPGRVETPFIPQKLERMGVVHVDVTV
jgi:hypothetical protein